jgi:hypothetical protein
MLEDHTKCMPKNNLSNHTQNTDKGNPNRYQYVVAVQNPKSRHFYHFMTETISRVFLVSDLLHKHPNMKIVGLSGRKSFIFARQSLEFMGLGQDRLVTTGCADYLIIPESAKCEGLDVAMLHVIRAYIIKTLRPLQHGMHALQQSESGSINKKKNYSQPAPGVSALRSYHAALAPSKHQYVGGAPRYVILVKRSGTRAVSNHDEVHTELSFALKDTHTVVVHRGNATLSQQLRLFAEADAVVAPHGAGLSLIMAMKKGSGVVEFVTEEGSNLCYLYIALKVKMCVYVFHSQYVCVCMYVCIYIYIYMYIQTHIVM